jgi:hypothetical protein
VGQLMCMRSESMDGGKDELRLTQSYGMNDLDCTMLLPKWIRRLASHEPFGSPY